MKEQADKKKESMEKEADEKAQKLHDKVKASAMVAAEEILSYPETEGAEHDRNVQLEKIAGNVEAACVLTLLVMSTL